MTCLTFRTVALIAGLALWSSVLPAEAQTVDCNNAMNTVEINFCADKDYQAADKALNDAYAMALKAVRSRDMEKPYDAKSFEEALRVAQRAWVAYRDAECKGVVAQIWTNGTGATSAILGCMTRQTLQRTRELKDDFETQ